METVRFKPWVGPEYKKNGIEGIRILVLGESHYGNKGEEHEDYTIRAIEDRAIDMRLAFFTKIAKSVLYLPVGEYLSDERLKIFWNSVSFYNYVQQFAGKGPRQRPSNNLWEQASQAFLNTINQLQAQICIVFGYELWKHLPSPGNEISSDGYLTYVYDIGADKKMFTGCVAHPCGGLCYSEAQPRIRALINIAKGSVRPANS